jgi:hypothetical protein
MRTLRTHLEAFFTANAFGLVDYPDVAMLSVYMGGADRTILDAKRGNALPTW